MFHTLVSFVRLLNFVLKDGALAALLLVVLVLSSYDNDNIHIYQVLSENTNQSVIKQWLQNNICHREQLPKDKGVFICYSEKRCY